MAKSARASSRKKNTANLRAKVFGPAHDARTERLSTKLQELAAAPKAEQETKMNGESEDTDQSRETATTSLADVQMKDLGSKPNVLKKSKKSGRIQKSNPRRKGKSMVFASEVARQKRQADIRKKRK